MRKKIKQKDFTEEMFDAVYVTTMSESTTVSQLLETALSALKKQGFDVPDYEIDAYEGGVKEYQKNPEIRRWLKSFTKRFQKLTGYVYE